MGRFLLSIFILTLITACNVTKRLPDGEKLYTGADIKIEGENLGKSSRKDLKEDLQNYITPKPNTKLLGVYYKLWLYQISDTPRKEKGLKNWLHNKIGEPPVLARQVDLSRNVSVIINRLENKGYFKAEATGDTVAKDKKVHAEYTAKPGVQYSIRKVILPDDTTLTVEKNMVGASQYTFLKPGDPYDLDVIIAERKRIDDYLKRRGYYFFNPDYLLMRVDSTVGNKMVDVFVTVKDDMPSRSRQPHYINNIYIYPNYSLDLDTINIENKDVEKYKDYYVIDPERKFKPKVFEQSMNFHKGELYNVADHNMSLKRLVNLGTFKFVKNRFEIAETNSDSAKLDAYYYLTPQKQKTIRAEATGKTNTAGYAGTELELSWRNRNTFRGAELLTIKGYAGLDFQISGQNKGYNIFRFGTEGSLTWPRFLPINFPSASAYLPRTQLTVGYDWQKRFKLYTLNTLRGSWGYVWKQTERKEHELNLLNLTFVKSSEVTEEYLDKIKEDSTLARVIEKQLIIGPSYSYTYTNTANTNRNGIYYNGKLDLSANILGIAQKADAKAGDYKELFGVRYSQYVKTEQDFRYYIKLGRNPVNQWANRIYAGIGLPYGNSLELPFIKQFYSGGTNSLRGFRARTLGPGSYRPNVGPDDFLPDQTGDIKLEFNSEFRFKIISILQGAAFTDIGNIWLKNESEFKPGGKFTNEFLKQLAADVGVGLRLDLSILILRADFAIPVRKPWLPEGERMVFDQIDFGSKSWRKENLIFNLAIGMPF